MHSIALSELEVNLQSLFRCRAPTTFGRLAGAGYLGTVAILHSVSFLGELPIEAIPYV